MNAISGRLGSSPFPVLLGLEARARRAASPTELAFIMVNETHNLLRYRQAALWLEDGGVTALSGVSDVDRSAPFTLWLNRAFRQIPQSSVAPLVARADALDGADREAWSEWLPAHAVWVALAAPDGTRFGTLMLARDEPWSPAETLLLGQLAESYGLSWAWLSRPRRFAAWQRLRRARRWKLVLAAVLAGLSMLPVRLSVLAPAEIVARNPAVIRSPLDGVIETMHVQPNEIVTEGQLLLELDVTTLRGRLEVAHKALQTETADYERTAQQAFADPRAKAQLGVIQGRIEERRAEVAQLDDLLARSQLRAPQTGVAILDDPSEWEGRPVVVGEKVLSVANETDTEIEAWLAPGDLIELSSGAPVTLFLNVDPLHAVPASVRYVAYEATARPDGSYAYRVRAATDSVELPPERAPRLGLKGTARLDGERVPLIYWLMRRPWTVMRQTIGW